MAKYVEMDEWTYHASKEACTHENGCPSPEQIRKEYYRMVGEEHVASSYEDVLKDMKGIVEGEIALYEYSINPNGDY